MAPLVDVAGLRPRLGDVEAPPRSRSSLSSVAGVESEPPGRARRRPPAEARAESEPWHYSRYSHFRRPDAAENKPVAAENKLFSAATGLFSAASGRQKNLAENKA
jgi:hypothetical protein